MHQDAEKELQLKAARVPIQCCNLRTDHAEVSKLTWKVYSRIIEAVALAWPHILRVSCQLPDIAAFVPVRYMYQSRGV